MEYYHAAIQNLSDRLSAASKPIPQLVDEQKEAVVDFARKEVDARMDELADEVIRRADARPTLAPEFKPVYGTLDLLLSQLELRTRCYIDDNFVNERAFQLWNDTTVQTIVDAKVGESIQETRTSIAELRADLERLVHSIDALPPPPAPVSDLRAKVDYLTKIIDNLTNLVGALPPPIVPIDPNSKAFVANELACDLVRRTGLMGTDHKFYFVARPLAKQGEFAHALDCTTQTLIPARIESNIILARSRNLVHEWYYGRNGTSSSAVLHFAAPRALDLENACIIVTTVFPHRQEEIFSCKDSAGNYIVVEKQTSRSLAVATHRGAWLVDLLGIPRGETIVTFFLKIANGLVTLGLSDVGANDDCILTRAPANANSRFAASATSGRIALSGARLHQLVILGRTKGDLREFYHYIK